MIFVMFYYNLTDIKWNVWRETKPKQRKQKLFENSNIFSLYVSLFTYNRSGKLLMPLAIKKLIHFYLLTLNSKKK